MRRDHLRFRLGFGYAHLFEAAAEALEPPLRLPRARLTGVVLEYDLHIIWVASAVHRLGQLLTKLRSTLINTKQIAVLRLALFLPGAAALPFLLFWRITWPSGNLQYIRAITTVITALNTAPCAARSVVGFFKPLGLPGRHIQAK